MNENLNLIEILKDCPKGTKLYSPLFGEVEFQGVTGGAAFPVTFPITVSMKDGNTYNFTLEGRAYTRYDGECLLFPSKDQRDWIKFNPKKHPKFDPKTLQPFDKVLVRDYLNDEWRCTFFSHIRQNCKHPYICDNLDWKYCIPYNDDTKHLVGTTEEAPEYYRYWEN